MSLYMSIPVFDKRDVSLTFGPFQQVDLQNCLRWCLPPSDQQPHNWPRLLQGLHCPAVNHLRHVHIVHTQHTVIHSVDRKVRTHITTAAWSTRNSNSVIRCRGGAGRDHAMANVIRILRSTWKSSPYHNFCMLRLWFFQWIITLRKHTEPGGRGL